MKAKTRSKPSAAPARTPARVGPRDVPSSSAKRATATKRSPLVIGGVIAVIVLGALLAGFFVLRPVADTRVPAVVANAPQVPGEVVYADVIGDGLSSSAISVLGIRVGMTESQVLDVLGPADVAQEYDFGAIQNWEYSTRLGLNRTGMIVHLRQGVVTRIMLYPAMNRYLLGETAVNGTKEDIYAVLGVPDRQFDIRGGRYFVYNERGLEVFFGAFGESALGIVLENRKLPTTATMDMGENVTRPAVPRLIMDTTTLCDLGTTYAFNIGTGVCREYPNACAIPDNEVEVPGCAPEYTTDEAIRAAIQASW